MTGSKHALRPRAAAVLLALGACMGTPALAQELVLDAAADATLYDDDPNGANGAGTGLFAGRTDLGDRRRALLRFDLSALPADATLTGAELELSMDRTIAGPVAFSLHRVLASWGEGNATGAGPGGGIPAAAGPGDSTWQSRFHGQTLWATPGGDFDPTASATVPVGATGSYTWSGPGLLADLQAWQADPAANFGWLLMADETAPAPTAKRFVAREAEAPAQGPLLRITYTVPAAPPPVATAQSIPASNPLALLALLAVLAATAIAGIRRR